MVAYVRVSTDEQTVSGAGLDAQREPITAEAKRRGWTVVAWHADEGISGSKGIEHRPGLSAAIDVVQSGEATRCSPPSSTEFHDRYSTPPH